MEKKLLVVGSINIDLVACANRLPAPGESILGHSFDVFNGGKGANQAVAIAKLGAPVDMIASLGTDLFTERLLSGLKVAGVDTHAVQIVPGPCGVALISRADNGENCIIVIPGANGEVSAADIDSHLDEVQKAAMVLVQLETPLETVIRLAEHAWAAKTPFMLDPAPAMPLPKELLSRTTWLTPNETEAQTLLGLVNIDPPAAAEKLLAMGARNVALKLGSQGVFLAGRDCPAATDSCIQGERGGHHRRRRLLQRRLRGSAHARKPACGRGPLRGGSSGDFGHPGRRSTFAAHFL